MILCATELGKSYPGKPESIEAVVDVSLELAAGECLAICGPSGSGKSTVLAMLAGLATPTRGSLTIAGTDPYRLSAGRRADFCRQHLGTAFQFSGLLPTLRAIDNVAFPALIGRGDDPYRRAAELLGRLGLGDRLEAYPNELSGGQQRRVAVARALVNETSIVLADEPTADLDPESADLVTNVLFEGQRRRNAALIVVTHDEKLASRADRTLWLAGGQIARETTGVPAPLPQIASPAAVGVPVARLGADFRGTLERFGIALAVGVGAIAAFDSTFAAVQRNRSARIVSDRRDLESAALRKVRFDIERIRLDAEGRFVLTVYLDPLPGAPRYATAPLVRAFVQVDRDWIEIPCEPVGRRDGSLTELAGRAAFDFRFQPKLEKFAELIPGYLHVRFSASTLVARNPTGVGGFFDRIDDVYAYLKPVGSDDAEICRKNRWNSAPLWIGMPAH